MNIDKMKQNEFISEGVERLRLCLQRQLTEEKYKMLFKHFPDAIDTIVRGYIPFAHSAIYPYKVEVDGGAASFDGGLVPPPILIAVDWQELGDWTLSQPEGSYLSYLAYKAWIWDEGFYIPEQYKSRGNRSEALLDAIEEKTQQPWDLASTLQLQEVDECHRKRVPFEEVFVKEQDEQRDAVEVYAQKIRGQWVEYKPETDREVFIRGRLNKYCRAIRVAWEQGKSYDEMLAINPEEFGLPEFKEGDAILPDSREYAVLLCLGAAYYLYVEERNSAFVPIRKIAEQLRIPYSKMMQAYNIVRKGVRDGKHNKEED